MAINLDHPKLIIRRDRRGSRRPVMVMYAGQDGRGRAGGGEIFSDPQHPCESTQALLNTVPALREPRPEKLQVSEGSRRSINIESARTPMLQFKRQTANPSTHRPLRRSQSGAGSGTMHRATAPPASCSTRPSKKEPEAVEWLTFNPEPNPPWGAAPVCVKGPGPQECIFPIHFACSRVASPATSRRWRAASDIMPGETLGLFGGNRVAAKNSHRPCRSSIAPQGSMTWTGGHRRTHGFEIAHVDRGQPAPSKRLIDGALIFQDPQARPQPAHDGPQASSAAAFVREAHVGS